MPTENSHHLASTALETMLTAQALAHLILLYHLCYGGGGGYRTPVPAEMLLPRRRPLRPRWAPKSRHLWAADSFSWDPPT